VERIGTRPRRRGASPTRTHMREVSCLPAHIRREIHRRQDPPRDWDGRQTPALALPRSR
jgi:hypothetical protein